MDKTPSNSRQPKAKWTDAERMALLQLGLLEFWPEKIPGPEQIESERAILPYEMIGGERVSRLVTDTPEAQQFIEAAKKKQAREVELHGLNTKSQLSVFCRWIDLPEDLWQDRVWCECMILRYAKADAPAVEWISRSLRRRLNTEAAALSKSSGADGISDDEYEHAALRAAEPLRDGLGMRTIGEVYLRAKVSSQPALRESLSCPISQSKIFVRVALKWQRDRWSPIPAPRPSVADFLLYLSLPQEHRLAWLGRALYLLKEIEHRYGGVPASEVDASLRPFWPEPFDIHQLRPSKEYQWIARKYACALSVSPDVFRDIFTVYHIATLEEYGRTREATRHTVFWFAKLLAILRRHAHTQCVRGTQSLKANIVTPFSVKTPRGDQERQRESLAAACRALLSEQFLLNSVFHSEVFDGRSWLHFRQPHGRPERRAEGLAAAYAWHRLFSGIEKTSLQSIDAVLSRRPSYLSSCVLLSIERSQGRSPYSYLAPLMTSLSPASVYPYDRYAALTLCRRYEPRRDLVRFMGNLSWQFEATQRWLAKNHSI